MHLPDMSFVGLLLPACWSPQLLLCFPLSHGFVQALLDMLVLLLMVFILHVADAGAALVWLTLCQGALLPPGGWSGGGSGWPKL